MRHGTRAGLNAPLCSLVLVLAGCGGGGAGDVPPPSPPTPLPASVTIAAQTQVQSAASVAFAPSFQGSNGLMFQWDFGDGSAASAEPAPSHVFARPGDFQVRLTVSDASGASRSASFDIVVNSQAHVRGLVCSAADDAGWCWSRAVQGNGDLFNDVFFLDGQTGWAAGDAGALYKTADGGKTWVSALQLPGERVQQVAFGDTGHGWALTRGGKLYASTNGGASWTLQLDRSAELAAGSASLALVVADGQRLVLKGTSLPSMVSADGGQSWRTINEPVLAALPSGVVWGGTGRSIDFGGSFTSYGAVSLLVDAAGSRIESLGDLSVVNADVAVRQILYRGLISNHYFYASAVAVTTDGGANWSRREIGSDGPRYGLGFPSPTNAVPASIYAASASKLWALDGARVARSVDGGGSWTWVPKGPWPEFTSWFGEPILSAGMTDPANPDAFSMVVAEGAQGDGGKAVLRTTDGGVSWKRYAPVGFAAQKAIASFKRLGPQSLLWQSGSKSLFRTDDDGAHWELLAGTSRAASAVGGMALWDDRQGLAVQRNGDLLSTADGGRTWTVQSPGGFYDGNEPALQVFDNTVWLLRRNVLSVSADRGKTWADQQTALGTGLPAAMYFFDARRGIVATTDLAVLSTSDGGATWVPLGTLPASSGSMPTGSMSFSSAAVGLLRGSYGIHVTRDGGATWKNGAMPAGAALMAAQLVDGLHGWAVGARSNVVPATAGVLFETSDGGLSWTEKPLPPATPPLNALHFQAPGLGWIVGNSGTILVTRDGGLTWTRQHPGATTRDFTAVFFNSSKTGWLGGALGEFMATGTGGR